MSHPADTKRRDEGQQTSSAESEKTEGGSTVPEDLGDPTAPEAGAEKEQDTPSGPDAVEESENLADQLETAIKELADMKEQVLRARAEAENVRRRADQEISRARKYAVESFASELLPVKDSLDLAATVDLGDIKDDVVRNMHEGLGLTLRQLEGVFEKFGIAVLEPAAGDKLNPDLHQAMSLQESTDVPPNHILHVIQKGFTLNDRLLRPAMVIVAKAPAK
jgi:molecular chaperone GrpE